MSDYPSVACGDSSPDKGSRGGGALEAVCHRETVVRRRGDTRIYRPREVIGGAPFHRGARDAAP